MVLQSILLTIAGTGWQFVKYIVKNFDVHLIISQLQNIGWRTVGFRFSGYHLVKLYIMFIKIGLYLFEKNNNFS